MNNIQGKLVREGILTADELIAAKNLWIQTIQKTHFMDVIVAIQENKENQLRSQLGIYMDDFGILRCAGRFVHMPIHPKLMPKSSHFTKLCIILCHKRLLHAGVPQTLAEVRREYWVPQGRSAVQKIIRSCLICIHWEGGPFKTPRFAPLPKYVVSSEEPPFTFIGLDYLGPLFILDDTNLKKNWVCFFTCLNIRAVHIEVHVEDISTECFIACLRRFIARRGTPSLIVSDNASQLKLGYALIESIWKSVANSSEVQSYVANKHITWKFITEYAPWKGGYYERLVGLTKRSLRKALSTTKVTRTELLTLIVEIEAVLNSRPLVYLDNDINSGTALTPAHFLSINHKAGIPEIEISYMPNQDTRTKLLLMWKKGQSYINKFWQLWITEYLPSLRERHKIQMKGIKGEVDRKPKCGEIVIVNEDLPRGKWKMAQIVNLIKGDIDGVERAVTLRYPSGKLAKRPFKLIYPLECDDELVDKGIATNGNESIGKAIQKCKEGQDNKCRVKYQRSVRNAAGVARERIRMQCSDIDQQ